VVTLPADTALPVEGQIEELRQALREGLGAVLCAPPGAGKTTVVPLRLLEEDWLAGRRILVLEPRRLATRAAARRMATLVGEEVGGTVGYSTRDERIAGPRTRIEVVTEGVLTRRLQHDPSLPGVGLVVFDEVHERNLQTDLALALVLDSRGPSGPPSGGQGAGGLRPDLRLLAMSATLDAERVARLLGDEQGPAPVIVSEGRQHPVDIRWLPPPPRQRLIDVVPGAVLRALRERDSDVLVFLPGAGDIRRVRSALEAGALPTGVDVRPLFGALPIAEQDLALAPSPPGRRRVVLATDIAETSLTVEGVGTVVDSGQARTPRYDARTGLTRLHTGPISRSSAEQRAGRAGRTGPGLAYRLWSKLEQATRRPYPEPEIASVDLAGLALELAVWGAEPGELRFLDPPPQRTLEEGYGLLRMLGALDDDNGPTAEGRVMSDLPLHPRLARMVTGAMPLGLGWLACLLAALLEERDVLRGRPDDVPVDVSERLRLLADRAARHPAMDGQAVAAARRRAELLGQRVGVRPGAIDPGQAGRVLAFAYPDRIAQARGRGRFRLRGGHGAWVPANDPLVVEPFLVVAELDADRRDSRVRMAAALAPDDVEEVTGDQVERSITVAWDPERDDLRATVTERLDGLVLRTADGPAPPGPSTTAALVDHVRTTGLGALRWTEDDRALQARVAFLRRTDGEEAWPDFSDPALLATVDEWLTPRLADATGRADLRALDMGRVLRRLLGHERVAHLEALAPPTLRLASGRKVPVRYDGDQPRAAVRVQDAFGTTRHPTVAEGRVPVVLELLSPAGRPVQVTADLPGFWAGSYGAVRKEMAWRYPKHAWPVDPSVVQLPGRGGQSTAFGPRRPA
jgi:ATP-dependent helicase HrpB